MRPISSKFRRWAFLAALAAATPSLQQLGPTTAQAQMIGPTQPVMGVIVNRSRVPVPGCRVQLQNQQVGPSPASVTNSAGFYEFPTVPVSVNAPYVLQVYWGPRLVFQNYLTHLGQQTPIQLQ